MHNSNWDWPASCVTGNDVDCCYELRPIVILCTGNYWLYVDTIYRTLYMCPRPSCNGVAWQWHHNGRDGVPNHQPHDCLLRSLFWRRSKKTSKLCVTGLCAGNSPVTGEFPAQIASNAENVSIWWRHHVWLSMDPSKRKNAHTWDI